MYGANRFYQNGRGISTLALLTAYCVSMREPGCQYTESCFSVKAVDYFPVQEMIRVIQLRIVLFVQLSLPA